MKLKYPLEEVLSVKQKRVKEAEKELENKKNALKIEEEKLKKIEEERDQVLHHHDSKLEQLRYALDHGTTSDEILQMKQYLKIVKENLEKENQRVQAQQEQVHQAEKNVEIAKEQLKQKRLEEEKMSLHKEQWMKEAKIELEKEEAKNLDEIGQTLYEAHRKKRSQ